MSLARRNLVVPPTATAVICACAGSSLVNATTVVHTEAINTNAEYAANVPRSEPPALLMITTPVA